MIWLQLVQMCHFVEVTADNISLFLSHSFTLSVYAFLSFIRLLSNNLSTQHILCIEHAHFFLNEKEKMRNTKERRECICIWKRSKKTNTGANGKTEFDLIFFAHIFWLVHSTVASFRFSFAIEFDFFKQSFFFVLDHMQTHTHRARHTHT